MQNEKDKAIDILIVAFKELATVYWVISRVIG